MLHRKILPLRFFLSFFLGVPASLCLIGNVWAQCPRFAASGEYPTAGQVLCNDNYATGYSNSRRSALWTAEKLIPEQIKAAQTVRAHNKIEEDPRTDESLSPADYEKSTLWQPLALAPPEDMASSKAKMQSLLISNIVPADPLLKSSKWKKLETNTRKLVGEYGALYVLTGVIFGDSSQIFGENHAKLPEKIWKIVYVPRQGTAAILCNNAQPPHCAATSVQEIENLSYIGLFPGLPESATRRKLNPAHWPGI